ncbi:45 kDa calcium-binding protein-like [Lineus longissimus]|uniref:45 kDa calcium-binding protein-like n=1 Tax=Lineus longissimus TaxID=88925 RepID=UPI00315D444D
MLKTHGSTSPVQDDMNAQRLNDHTRTVHGEVKYNNNRRTEALGRLFAHAFFCWRNFQLISVIFLIILLSANQLVYALPAIPRDLTKSPDNVLHVVTATGRPLLKKEDLQPPDHLDAVRMEQDGHLNRDYRKEVFLGNHEAFEDGTAEETVKKLEDIVHRVDVDKDGLISLSELEDWIIQKVQEHFDESLEENAHVFKALDPDNDGFITWKEFFIQFLMAKGYSRQKAEQHSEDYESVRMDEAENDQLIRYKFRWSEADEDPQDNRLTINEFKNFRHPEQSKTMLNHMVKDILSNLDQEERDGILTESEFVVVPIGDVEVVQSDWLQQEQQWKDERQKEFREIIDTDRNGRVTSEELLAYVDPKNPNHAKQEAKNLINLADTDKDLHLSLKEILENKDLFIGSKMCNAGKNFHDEF